MNSDQLISPVRLLGVLGDQSVGRLEHLNALLSTHAGLAPMGDPDATDALRDGPLDTDSPSSSMSPMVRVNWPHTASIASW